MSTPSEFPKARPGGLPPLESASRVSPRGKQLDQADAQWALGEALKKIQGLVSAQGAHECQTRENVDGGSSRSGVGWEEGSAGDPGGGGQPYPGAGDQDSACGAGGVNVLLATSESAFRQKEELERTLHDLTEAKETIRTLTGILPICSKCKKIRDDDGEWQPMESYVSQHSEAQFSHGLCKECLAELYPDLAD